MDVKLYEVNMKDRLQKYIRVAEELKKQPESQDSNTQAWLDGRIETLRMVFGWVTFDYPDD